MYQKSKFFAEICAILAQIPEDFEKYTDHSTVTGLDICCTANSRAYSAQGLFCE